MIAMAKVCCNNPYLDYNEINARSYLDGDEVIISNNVDFFNYFY